MSPLGTYAGRLVAVTIVSAIVAALPASAAADRFDPTRPPIITLEQRSDYPRAVVLGDGTIVAQWFHDEADITGGATSIQTCRIPAGAGACDGPPTVMLDGGPYGESALLQPDPVDSPDEIQSVSYRSESGELRFYVRTSTDGGRTWGASKHVASNGSQLRAVQFVHGPGAFGYSSLSSGYFQSASYDASGGLTLSAPKLEPSHPPSSTTYWEGVGTQDSTTPVVVFETDEGSGRRLFSRRFTGGGQVNEETSWAPAAVTAPSRGVYGVVGLASGPRGLFVAFDERTASVCGRGMAVARYNGNGFDEPVPVDPVPHNGCVLQQPMAFGQDPSGALRAVWTFYDNGRDPAMPDGLYTAVSGDGGLTWTNPIRLYPYDQAAANLNEPTTGPPIASNPAGDAIVMGRGSSTGERGATLMRLPSIAAAYAQPGPAPPPGPPPPPPPPPPVPPAACSQAKFGAVNALALVGCFVRKGKTYASTGPVRVNGIDLKPAAATGRAAAAAAAPAITFDASSNTIKASGSWRASASAVDLGQQAINWYVPPTGGQVLDAVTREPARLNASAIKQRVLGLPVSGLVLPSFLTNGTAQLPLNLQLPGPLGGIDGGPLTDNVVLSTGNSLGIKLGRGGVSIELPKVSLGIAEIDPFKITYESDPFVFKGLVGINLPVIGGGINASLVIQDGEFVDATADYEPSAPGIPLTGFAYLTKVGLSVHKGLSCPDPTRLEIRGSVSAGPKIAGVALIEIDGAAGYKLPEGACNRPGEFYILGTGKLVSLGVADTYVRFTTDGVFTFGASVTLGSKSTGLYGGIDGGIDFGSGDFYARGRVEVNVLGFKAASVDAVVGSVGLGACVGLTPLPPIPYEINAGAKYRWGGDLDIYLENCDVSDLVPARFAGARAAQAGVPNPATVAVRAGTKVQSFVARGADRAPQFTLVSPAGKRYAMPAAGQPVTDLGDGVRALTDDGLRLGTITVPRPAAGTWRLEPVEASVPFTRVEGAVGGDPPKVSAQVRRVRGRTFALSYRASLPKGARVTFFDSTGARLTRAQTARRGTLRFTSSTGKRGRRAVIARVESEAGPLAGPVVARFTAPGPVRLGRAGKVQLLRGKGRNAGLRVAWKPANGATRYVVRAALRDGRRIELPASRRRRVAIVPSVPGFDSARITVYAVAKDGRVGPGAKARLKAVKPKPKRKRRS